MSLERLEFNIDFVQKRCEENALHAAAHPEIFAGRESTPDIESQVRKARAESFVPRRYADADLAQFRRYTGTDQGRVAAQVVVDSKFSMSLALFGADRGIGKTYLICAIANAAMRAGIAAAIVNVADLLVMLRDSRRKWATSEDEVIERFANMPVLGLDDFGKEPLDDRSTGMLYQLCNRRWNSGLPLLLTSSMDCDAAYKRLRDRKPFGETDDYAPDIADRIRGMIPAERWFEMTGKSQR